MDGMGALFATSFFSEFQEKHVSKISPTGPTERTHENPECLKSLDRNLRKGIRWQGPIQFLMEFVQCFFHVVVSVNLYVQHSFVFWVGGGSHFD